MSRTLSLFALLAGFCLMADALKFKHDFSHHLNRSTTQVDEPQQYRVQYNLEHIYGVNSTRPAQVKDIQLDLICKENDFAQHNINILNSSPLYSSVSNRAKKSKDLVTVAKVNLQKITTQNSEGTTIDSHRQ